MYLLEIKYYDFQHKQTTKGDYKCSQEKGKML